MLPDQGMALPAPTDAGDAAGRRPTRAAVAHVQLPRELLRSRAHSALAVVLWAHYEDLMVPGIGGRAPARARRCTVGAVYGIATTAVDAARRELLAEGAGGPWLRRSAPQGAKRAVRHVALRRPRDTGGRYVRVPQWTRDLVWAGRTRPAGRISPAAWRLYARAVDRTGDAGGTFDASVRELGALLEASADTGRRRLGELEAAGLCAVTERSGGRLSVRVIVRQEDAEEAAGRYAEHGRAQAEPRQDPPQVAALTPRSERQSPPAAGGAPQDAPAVGSSQVDARGVPASEDVQEVGERGAPADAGRSRSRSKDGPTPRRPRRGARLARPAEAAAVYRALPAALRERIPEHGSRRVLRAIGAELELRSVAELAARVARRAEAWRYRPEDVGDATAVAITIVRRGYACPDVRCEDRVRLDTGEPCTHCETAPAPPEPQPAGPPSSPTPTPPPVADAIAAALAGNDGQGAAAAAGDEGQGAAEDEGQGAAAAAVPDDDQGLADPARRGADLARRLMRERAAGREPGTQSGAAVPGLTL